MGQGHRADFSMPLQQMNRTKGLGSQSYRPENPGKLDKPNSLSREEPMKRIVA